MDVANLDDLEDECLFTSHGHESNKVGQDGFAFPQDSSGNTVTDILIGFDGVSENSIVVVLDHLRVAWKERRHMDSRFLLQAISKCLQPGQVTITPMVSFAHCRGMALLLDVIRNCLPQSTEMSQPAVMLMREVLRMLEGWCDVVVEDRLMLLRLVNNDELNQMVSILLEIIHLHGRLFGQNLVSSSSACVSSHLVLDALAVSSSIFKFCPLAKHNMDFVNEETVRILMSVGELCISSPKFSSRVYQVLEIIRCAVPSADGTSVYAYSRYCMQKRYVPTGCFCEACTLAFEHDQKPKKKVGSFATSDVMMFILNLIVWRCEVDDCEHDSSVRDNDLIRLLSLVIGLQQLDVVPKDLRTSTDLILLVLQKIANRLYGVLANLQDHAELWRSLVAIAQAVSVLYWWALGPVGLSLDKDHQARIFFHRIGTASETWGTVLDVAFRAFSELLPRPNIKAVSIRGYPLLSRCPIGVVMFILHLSVEIAIVHPQSLLQLELRHKRILSILLSFCEKEYHDLMRRNRYDFGFQPLSLLSVMANHSPGIVGPSLSRLHHVDRALSWFVALHKDCTVAGELSSAVHRVVVFSRTAMSKPSGCRSTPIRSAETFDQSHVVWRTILSLFGARNGSHLAMTLTLFSFVFGGAACVMVTIMVEIMTQNDLHFTALLPASVSVDSL